jgi:hypothetical protein
MQNKLLALSISFLLIGSYANRIVGIDQCNTKVLNELISINAGLTSRYLDQFTIDNFINLIRLYGMSKPIKRDLSTKSNSEDKLEKAITIGEYVLAGISLIACSVLALSFSVAPKKNVKKIKQE